MARGAGLSAALLTLVASGAARAQDDAEPAIPDLPDMVFDEEAAADSDTEEEEEAPLDQEQHQVSLDDMLRVEIVSATKTRQVVSEAPSAIAVFTRDQIRRYGWNSLNDILYHQPGFAPARDYDRPTVAARGGFEGWNNNHLLLLIDGVPFNDALYGSAYTWEITPLSIANTIEVSRGPGSALYGTNATNGVIAITTVSPAHLGTFGEAHFRLGDHGTQHHDFLVADTWRRLSLTVAYDTFSTDGNEYLSHDGSGRTDGGGALEEFRVQDGRDSDYFFAKLEGNGALKGLSLQLHNQAWSFETGHGWLWWIPDARESMDESRQIVSLAYRRDGSGDHAIDQEYVLRYQRHAIDWNMRYYTNGAYDGFYPSGVSEYLNTAGHELFARAQATRRLRRDGSALIGVEYTGFLYLGDDAHYANAALNDVEGGYPPTAGPTALGPWFEWIEDRPVSNVGLYGQVVSGGFLADRLNLTAGVRYDLQAFTYEDIKLADRPEHSKSFHQINPRAGLVITASPRLTFKLLAGRAFRAPAPSELFGANSWTLASNITELKPESIVTYEAATEIKLGGAVVLRGNGYYKSSSNQIAYSTTDNDLNLSTNIYSHEVVGAEGEVVVGTQLGRQISLDGFLNYSYVRLLDEQVRGLPENPDTGHLTWAPTQWGNLGAALRVAGWEASSQLHLQGPVRRRAGDLESLVDRMYRPDEVAAWASLDARLVYRPSTWIQIGLQGTNLTGSEGKLVKNNDYPFDYQIEARRLMATVDVEVR